MTHSNPPLSTIDIRPSELDEHAASALMARIAEPAIARQLYLAEMVLALAERVRTVGSFRLRLSQPGDKLEWVGTVDGVEKVYDSDPGVSFGTRLQLLLLFPFVSESLL